MKIAHLNYMQNIRCNLEPISLPEKDFWKDISANAKFKSLQQVLNVRVGINNFANFSFKVKSSLLMRDIILNSPYVSGWARSTQVLNDTDSKFSVYSKSVFPSLDSYNEELVKHMDLLFSKGHIQDNLRCLVPLGSTTEYAFTCDIMTLCYMFFALDKIVSRLTGQFATDGNLFLYTEASYFRSSIHNILSSYDVDVDELAKSFSPNLSNQFQSVGSCENLSKLTGLPSFEANVTYSVVGQVFRHRSLYKKFKFNDPYDFDFENIANTKTLTSECDYSSIDVSPEVSGVIQDYTERSGSIYQLLQGSIFSIEINGTPESIRKMLSQRICYINDTAHFKGMIDSFTKQYPNSKLYPPCKGNVSKFGCYVGYVNESRLKGEEKTQIPCPIWTEVESKENHKASLESRKSKWFTENLSFWKSWSIAEKARSNKNVL